MGLKGLTLLQSFLGLLQNDFNVLVAVQLKTSDFFLHFGSLRNLSQFLRWAVSILDETEGKRIIEKFDHFLLEVVGFLDICVDVVVDGDLSDDRNTL